MQHTNRILLETHFPKHCKNPVHLSEKHLFGAELPLQEEEREPRVPLALFGTEKKGSTTSQRADRESELPLFYEVRYQTKGSAGVLLRDNHCALKGEQLSSTNIGALGIAGPVENEPRNTNPQLSEKVRKKTKDPKLLCQQPNTPQAYPCFELVSLSYTTSFAHSKGTLPLLFSLFAL